MIVIKQNTDTITLYFSSHKLREIKLLLIILRVIFTYINKSNRNQSEFEFAYNNWLSESESELLILINNIYIYIYINIYI